MNPQPSAESSDRPHQQANERSSRPATAISAIADAELPLDDRLRAACRALADVLFRGGPPEDVEAARLAVDRVQALVERDLEPVPSTARLVPTGRPRSGSERPDERRDPIRSSVERDVEPFAIIEQPPPAIGRERPIGAPEPFVLVLDDGDLTEPDLAEVLAGLLSVSPGSTARQLAASATRGLGRPVARREVNVTLYRDPRFTNDDQVPPHWLLQDP